ncbi:MAG: RodZ domain-containing protein, partial [Pseudomonadota bacterium]|nr:RodZ domain-containing protein [Pseudomonadota bacterium]
DASGEQLYQGQMAEGETFTIPRDAEGPQVWTGRPWALAITVAGRPVPKLSEEDEIIRDVPVSAEALLTREQTGSGAAPTAGPTPAGTPIATQTGTR